MLLALTAAAALAALVVAVVVFWFGWYETRQNRDLLDSLPVFPGAEAVQDFPHASESDENPVSPPDKWVILRTYRVPDGTTKKDVAAFYMERMPPEWERCLRHVSTYAPATGRKGVLFTGAAFYLERAYVRVAVLNHGGLQSYDVFLDRHRNMGRDPCKPQPFITDPACYDLDPPAHTGRLISRDEAEGSKGWLMGGPPPGKGLGGRDRGCNRQLPDDVRGVYGAVLPAKPVYRHPTGHPRSGSWRSRRSRGVCKAASRGGT